VPIIYFAAFRRVSWTRAAPSRLPAQSTSQRGNLLSQDFGVMKPVVDTQK
jgi:hypothetical protein